MAYSAAQTTLSKILTSKVTITILEILEMIQIRWRKRGCIENFLKSFRNFVVSNKKISFRRILISESRWQIWKNNSIDIRIVKKATTICEPTTFTLRDYDYENDSASVLTPTISAKNCTIANVAKYYSRIYVA